MNPPAAPGLVAFYATFFVGAWLRRIVAYLAVVYGFEVLGGGQWSGLFYLCLVLPYVLSVYAGSVIDASSKRMVLHYSSALPVVILGLLALAEHGAWLGSGKAHGWLVAAFITSYGVVSAFAYPAFLTVIPDLAGRARTSRSTAIVNVLSMLCHACGPLAVGILRAHLAWPGLFVALTAIATLAWGFLFLVPLPPPTRTAHPPGSEWQRWRELWIYCRQHATLLALLAAVGLFAGLVIGPLEVLAPLFAQQALGGGPVRAGVFIATGGVGLMLGAIGALRLVDRCAVGAWLCGTVGAGAVFLLTMTWSPAWATFPLFFLGGLVGGLFSSLSVAAIQASATDALRGRVLGLFSLILGATPALGGLLAGSLVAATNTLMTMRLSFVVAALAFGLLYATQPALRTRSPTS